jgi:hypothetical protein
MPRDVFDAVTRAAMNGRGVRLTADEVAALMDAVPDIAQIDRNNKAKNVCATCHGSGRRGGVVDHRFESGNCYTCGGLGKT